MLRNKLLLITITLQVVFLLGMTASNYLIEKWGDVIQLQTEPYNPRDVFYGEYIQLDYVAEKVKPEYWFATDKVKHNQVIYVLLAPDERGIYQVKAASNKKLDAHDDDVVIKARYQYEDYQNIHRINFGVNRYYIEENSSLSLDLNRRMLVTIALSPWGQKKILKVEEME